MGTEVRLFHQAQGLDPDGTAAASLIGCDGLFESGGLVLEIHPGAGAE